MPNQRFYKYQGTGNDFIMIDDRNSTFNIENTNLIKLMCDRRFGIGADGLILLRKHAEFDFEMVYFNADGNQSSMCGNGGRCIVAFANYLGVVYDNFTKFTAIDGIHEAKVENEKYIHLKMNDVLEYSKNNDAYILNTGSPHYIVLKEQVDAIDVYKEGKAIRYNNTYQEHGINVNFLEQISDDFIKVRTYERGVEDETFSCGTGVVASCIASSIEQNKNINNFSIVTKGGVLKVNFEIENNTFKNIWLSGPAELVFEGYF